MFVSYAQNFEDVILNRALKSVTNGFYIDIGAEDPVTDSVSLAFYNKGWRGVHVGGTLGACLRQFLWRDPDLRHDGGHWLGGISS